MFHSFNHREVQENIFNFNKYENIAHIQNTHDDINADMDTASQNIQPKTLVQTVSEGFSNIVDMSKDGLNLLNASFKLYKNIQQNWYDISTYYNDGIPVIFTITDYLSSTLKSIFPIFSH